MFWFDKSYTHKMCYLFTKKVHYANVICVFKIILRIVLINLFFVKFVVNFA